MKSDRNEKDLAQEKIALKKAAKTVKDFSDKQLKAILRNKEQEDPILVKAARREYRKRKAQREADATANAPEITTTHLQTDATTPKIRTVSAEDASQDKGAALHMLPVELEKSEGIGAELGDTLKSHPKGWCIGGGAVLFAIWRILGINVPLYLLVILLLAAIIIFSIGWFDLLKQNEGKNKTLIAVAGSAYLLMPVLLMFAYFVLKDNVIIAMAYISGICGLLLSGIAVSTALSPPNKPARIGAIVIGIPYIINAVSFIIVVVRGYVGFNILQSPGLLGTFIVAVGWVFLAVGFYRAPQAKQP